MLSMIAMMLGLIFVLIALLLLTILGYMGGWILLIAIIAWMIHIVRKSIEKYNSTH